MESISSVRIPTSSNSPRFRLRLKLSRMLLIGMGYGNGKCPEMDTSDCWGLPAIGVPIVSDDSRTGVDSHDRIDVGVSTGVSDSCDRLVRVGVTVNSCASVDRLVGVTTTSCSSILNKNHNFNLNQHLQHC